jgi:hypothetical protein
VTCGSLQSYRAAVSSIERHDKRPWYHARCCCRRVCLRRFRLHTQLLTLAGPDAGCSTRQPDPSHLKEWGWGGWEEEEEEGVKVGALPLVRDVGVMGHVVKAGPWRVRSMGRQQQQSRGEQGNCAAASARNLISAIAIAIIVIIIISIIISIIIIIIIIIIAADASCSIGVSFIVPQHPHPTPPVLPRGWSSWLQVFIYHLIFHCRLSCANTLTCQRSTRAWSGVQRWQRHHPRNHGQQQLGWRVGGQRLNGAAAAAKCRCMQL